MPISPALFQSDIPFVHIEEVRLQENIDRELTVEVTVSNETKELSADSKKEFGNFIYLSTDADKILTLAENPQRLKKLILGSASDPSYLQNYQLSLTQQDFQSKGFLAAVAVATPPTSGPPTTTVLPGPKIYNHITHKTFILNRIKGGNIMTGLIADAHIEKVFETDRVLDIAAQAAIATTKRIKNLYLLVASYRIYENNCFLGNLTKEKIMENGNVPIQAKIWALSNDVGQYGPAGAVWPGDVHLFTPNPPPASPGPMVGTTPRPTPVPAITAATVSNTKVKDMRFVTSAQRLKFDYFSPFTREMPYFSPLTLSRDIKGQIHGVFGFDLSAYARQNAKFGPLIKNLPALLSCVGIAGIKIYRRAIKRDTAGNKLTPSPNLNSDIPAEGWTAIPRSGTNNYIRMIDLPRINEQGFVNIIFVDTGATKYTSGTLEYRVEIVINDKTLDTVTRLRDDMLEYVSRYREMQQDNDPSDEMTNFVITKYLTTLNFIFGATPFALYSLEAWKKNLLTLAAKENTNSADRTLVVNLIRDFTAKLSAQLATTQSKKEGGAQVYSNISHPRPPGALSTTHYFRNRYKLENPPGVGIEYLIGHMNNQTTALPTVSFDDYELRADEELAKYGLAKQSPDGLNEYGYLSPSALVFGSLGGRPRISPTIDFNLRPTLFLPLYRNQTLGTFQYAQGSTKDAPTDITEIFNAAGTNVTVLKGSLREVLFPSADRISEPTPATGFMGTMSAFNLNAPTIVSALSGSNQTIQAAPLDLSTSIYNSPISQWILNQQVVAFSLPAGIQNPASIAGSAALNKFNNNPTIIEDSNSLSNIINFESLVRVEYLKAYDTTLGATGPQWEILNATAFTLARAGGSLLCRLVPILNIIDTNIDFGLRPLSTLFVLGPPTVGQYKAAPLVALNETENYVNTLATYTGEPSPYSRYSINVLVRPPV
tara:strand:+ start:44204 stop:47020 length:2817 start_codon:yes stop_codon:yes gene_type:complete